MSLDLDACSDGELAMLAAAGRQAAFATLMRRHREPVYRLIRSYIGDADEALDLVQESFVSAYEALTRYDPARPFRAWLSRIAINKCRDRARRRAVRHLFLTSKPLVAGMDVREEGPDAATRAEGQDELKRVSEAIARLPAALKEPLLLHTIEGLSQAETAEALGISQKAVETRVRRARVRLLKSVERPS